MYNLSVISCETLHLFTDYAHLLDPLQVIAGTLKAEHETQPTKAVRVEVVEPIRPKAGAPPSRYFPVFMCLQAGAPHVHRACVNANAVQQTHVHWCHVSLSRACLQATPQPSSQEHRRASG